jgi:hypothetical protein
MFSAVQPTTDIAKILRHVRFVPGKRLMHRNNYKLYSITWSARASIVARVLKGENPADLPVRLN